MFFHLGCAEVLIESGLLRGRDRPRPKRDGDDGDDDGAMAPPESEATNRPTAVAVPVSEVAADAPPPKLAGASSGALVAAALACGVPLPRLRDFCLRMVRFSSGRAGGPACAMSRIVREGLEDLLPPDAHLLASGRLYVQVSMVTTTKATATATSSMASSLLLLPPVRLKGRMISIFQTREELVNALLASCYIPLYYESPTSIDGHLALDGGFTDRVPSVVPGCDRVIRISPGVGGGGGVGVGAGAGRKGVIAGGGARATSSSAAPPPSPVDVCSGDTPLPGTLALFPTCEEDMGALYDLGRARMTVFLLSSSGWRRP